MFKIPGFSNKSESWSKTIDAVAKALKGVSAPPELQGMDVDNIALNVNAQLKADIKQIEGESFIYSKITDIAEQSKANVRYLRHWHVMGEEPSLCAMTIATMEHFGVEAPDYKQAVICAALLGEYENTCAYHNNTHFKKVLLQAIRLMNAHNNIYAGTARSLNEREIALMLIAASIHDLGHDGLGNTVKGVFTQGRLEERSIDLALPYLEKAGLTDENDLNALRIMILCTDVSPLGELSNPMGQMKAAYRYHFQGEDKKHPKLNLSPELTLLEKDAKIALMSCLLHEADIATSAAIDYTVTQFETGQYRQEIGQEDARPEHVIDFLNHVCQRKFLTAAGQELYSANMARIYALAEDDFQNGNDAYPKPQHTDFILTLGHKDAQDGQKTIN